MNHKYNFNHNSGKKEKNLTKNNISVIYFLTFTIYFAGIYYSKNTLVAAIIIGISAVVPIILYIFKIAKLKQNDTALYKYSGELGIYNSFICAILISFQKSNNIGSFLLILIALIAILGVIIYTIEFFYRILMKRKKDKASTSVVSIGIISIFSASGVFVSRYLQKNGIILSYEVLLGLFYLLFSTFYFFIIKYRNLSKKEHSGEQSGDINQGRQSGDDSMIDS